MATLFSLPSLRDDFDEFDASQAVLPDFKPRFFIPMMLDKPQNPIIDTLKLHNSAVPVATPLPLPTELASLTLDSFPPRIPALSGSAWTEAGIRGCAQREILSWDALRPDYPGRASPSAFISEQDSLVFAAARYLVQARLNDPGTEVRYVKQHELLASLKMTVLGLSSPLHTWDPVSETFVPVVSQKGTRGILLVDDKDETASASFISRFLSIGTLLRRLEILVATLRSKFAKEGPTIHAFTHALSTILFYLRESLAQCPPQEGNASMTLVAVWSQYEQSENILTALATLCDREEQVSPRDYPVPDHTPINLLSSVYYHLQSHIERQSPKAVTAVIAFILTSASREYFQQLSRSVGFGGGSSIRQSSRVVGEQNDQYALDMDEDGVDERDDLDSISDSFPTFFPPRLVDVLPAAQKSLVLLRAAEPNHPLLRAPSVVSVIQWFWTWSEIEAAWNRQGSASTPKAQHLFSPECPSPAEDVAVLAQFRIFDLEPGDHFGHTLLDDKRAPSPISALQDFIDAFPQSLPPIIPTLSHLTSLIFESLVEHASTLSTTLLSMFLSPSAPLQFKPHMELLHSYLLLAAPSFKSRLAAALFSDSQGWDPGEAIPMSLRAIGGNGPKKRDRSHRWPVGLSFAFLERETWPPVGADLSFFLRTVIVDSFERHGEHLAEDDIPSSREMFWVEAERRLGFAIRDLPTIAGHDKWLNPLCESALDFLYMDYKPPHPLDILITPDILSKYQRMFTHLLRIMRVEHALSAVFRMGRSTCRPVFPTLTSSNKLLLHFRFIAQSFVTNLSQYIVHTAINGNFDPFLERLSPSGDLNPPFSDVFALAKAHSALMDDVLGACLLRSSQRVAGDLLRQALELVLEFAVLVGDLKTDRLEEYQAAPLLEDLSRAFRAKMAALVRSLKTLADVPVGPALVISSRGHGRTPTGGIQAIVHLLESLSGWWSNC
ncbi:gamma-tubulin complex, DGRIP91/SPC98 component protein [Mycena pura]|uniref:Spindle pole body component n=1 Tax=Mycena pura TaxID=153505 RepID=A0AAD6VMQ9_9AGAR|nr:gamma-tubulin complex, DGRIP91/SPC98 component protein [Mycena pura]